MKYAVIHPEFAPVAFETDTMRHSPKTFEKRLQQLRRKSLAVVLICTVNLSGCHNGSMRSVQRPKIFTNPFRRQSIATTPGYTTVESPGAVVIEQPGSINTSGGNYGEPPATQLEARPSNGSVTSIVPSFDDAQKPLGSGSQNNYGGNGLSGSSGSYRESLAPPAEAPQVMMEAPPVGGLDRKPSTNPSLDSSATRTGGSSGDQEPRLEYLEPRRPAQNGTSPSGSSDKSSGGSTSSPIGNKPSAWRTPKFGDVSGRTTYQASSRTQVQPEVQKIGVLD